MSIGMKYDICTISTLSAASAGQFSAPTAPSGEILLTEFFFFCIGTTFIICIFFQKWLFPQKILKKSILLYSKRMVICNFHIQHNLAQNSEMCQKLPILMVNKMVKNWTLHKSAHLVNLADLCFFMK